MNQEDIQITCSCGVQFTWTVNEQRFFAEKGFQTPKRCPACRALKNQERGNLTKNQYDRPPRRNYQDEDQGQY